MSRPVVKEVGNTTGMLRQRQPVALREKNRSRWMGVGSSLASESRRAAMDAVGAALADRADAGLLVVFASVGHDPGRLLEGIAEAGGDVPMIGCGTSGEIAGAEPLESSVVVMALGGPGFSVATAGAARGGDLRATAATVAGCVERVRPQQHRALVLLSDGGGGDQLDIVRGAYQVTGASVPLVGGCNGTDPGAAGLYLDGEQTFGLVGAAISSDAPIRLGVRHGWRAVGDPMQVTHSDGTRVYSLDDHPALDVYLNRLDAPASVRQDPEAFARFAITHPLGLNRRSSREVRCVVGADFDDRSLSCIASIPQSGLTWLMEGDRESVLGATDDAAGVALAGLEAPPLGLLAFDCIGRREVLGQTGARAALAGLQQMVDGAPIGGFYTSGEIGRHGGAGGFHNQTMVVVAFS
jgi:hypothetical protein